MLEQAVYARRNHTAILAGVSFAAAEHAAQAADVARAGPRRHASGRLLAGPDGGAWVTIRQRDGRTRRRAARARTAASCSPAVSATSSAARRSARTDSAWFVRRRPARRCASTRAGTASTVASRSRPRPGSSMCSRRARTARCGRRPTTGPSSRSWRPTAPSPTPPSARRTASEYWPEPSRPPAPPTARCGSATAAVASLRDGVARELVARRARPRRPTPPAASGSCVLTDRALQHGRARHARRARRPTSRSRAALGVARDVAVAPDGSAWFAVGNCTLARVTADGTVTTVARADPRPPDRVRRHRRAVAREPGCGSRARLDGRCDDDRPTRSRRRRGSRLALRSPARHPGHASREPRELERLHDRCRSRDASFSAIPTERVLPRGGSRPRARRLPRPPPASSVPTTDRAIVVDVDDREGNERGAEFRVRGQPVRRALRDHRRPTARRPGRRRRRGRPCPPRVRDRRPRGRPGRRCLGHGAAR